MDINDEGSVNRNNASGEARVELEGVSWPTEQRLDDAAQILTPREGQKAVEVLESHFEAHGWPLNLSRDKLYARYRVVPDENGSVHRVVEIERHRPILGETYARGLPMHAFENYYMRYAVDPERLIVEALPERRGHLDISIEGLADSVLSSEGLDLCIETEEDRFRVRDSVSKDEALVSNFAETEEFALSFADRFTDYLWERMVEADVGIEKDTQERLIEAYRRALENQLLDRADRLWEERDD